METKRSYTLKKHHIHEGKIRQVGETIAIDEKTAKWLAHYGVVDINEAVPPATEESQEPQTSGDTGQHTNQYTTTKSRRMRNE